MGVVRKTKSVQTILEIFNQTEEAISVVELIERLKSQMNKTTIYRILERLEEDALLHSFLGHDGVKWYAKCHECSSHDHHDVHPHFQCVDCGKVDCVEIDVTIPKIPNRQVMNSNVLIRGRCEECV
ncbi:MAG: transcriptional regulator [Fluviicola sp. XM-24bin1]|nr:MAG: transcriptional regulator [Fluviicola sp. XM-24bin1]